MASSFYPPGFSTATLTESVGLAELPAMLRMLLVADGTVTKLLEALFWRPVAVRLIGQDLVEGSPQSTLERKVVLVVGDVVCAFASSTIVLDHLEPDLRAGLLSGSKGIGALLREERLETYRKLEGIVHGTAEALAGLLRTRSDAQTVARTYSIQRSGQVIMRVTEVFPVDVYRHVTA